MPILLPEEDFEYGVVNRPSTPVKLVIGNCFAIEEANRKEAMYLSQTQKMKSTQGKKLDSFKVRFYLFRRKASSCDRIKHNIKSSTEPNPISKRSSK